MSNRTVANILSFFGVINLVGGIIGATITARSVNSSPVLKDYTLIVFIAIFCGSVVSACVLIAISRILTMINDMPIYLNQFYNRSSYDSQNNS